MGSVLITRRFGQIGGKDLINLIQLNSEEELPATADENTLAVITEDIITDWIFSAKSPNTPINGMLHIIANTSSCIPISLLNNQKVFMFPSGAAQYLNGIWVHKPLYIYKEGTWNLSRFYIIKAGFKQIPLNVDSYDSMVENYQESGTLYLNATSSKWCRLCTSIALDMTPHCQSIITWKKTAETNTSSLGISQENTYPPYSSAESGGVPNVMVFQNPGGNFRTDVFDISNYSSMRYLSFTTYRGFQIQDWYIV